MTIIIPETEFRWGGRNTAERPGLDCYGLALIYNPALPNYDWVYQKYPVRESPPARLLPTLLNADRSVVQVPIPGGFDLCLLLGPFGPAIGTVVYERQIPEVIAFDSNHRPAKMFWAGLRFISFWRVQTGARQ